MVFQSPVDTFKEFQTKIYPNRASYCTNHSDVSIVPHAENKTVRVGLQHLRGGSGHYYLLHSCVCESGDGERDS